MSFPEQSIEAIFANKKDKNYVEVLSHYSYLESFVLSDVKSVGLRIPETILVEHGGNLKSWMFNSKKDEELPILKKRAEKLNPAEIFNSFSRRKGGNSGKVRPATTMQNERREYINQPRAIVRYINGVVDSLDMVDFQDYLQTGLGYLKVIQQPLSVKSKSNYNASETYYCEYRHDDPLMPASFRFVKKVLQYSNPEENISSESYKSKVLFKGSNKTFPDATSGRDGQNIPGFSTTKEIKIQTKLIKKNSETFFRVLDTATNQKLEKLTRLYASYLTQSFKFQIKKLICKFTIDEFNEIYFMGAAELYVTVRESGLYEGGRSVQLDEMVTTMKRHNKEQAALIMLQNDDEPKKKSNKMLAEECVGDFCDFISLDSMKLAELASGHNVSKYFKKDVFAGRKLPFEITYNLVKRCKQDPEEIKNIFKYHRIFPRYYAEMVNDSPQALTHVDFSVRFKKLEHDNLQNLYKFVKVCKNCFPIYVTLQRILTENDPRGAPHFHKRSQTMALDPSKLDIFSPKGTSAVQSPVGTRSPISNFTMSKRKSGDSPTFEDTKSVSTTKPGGRHKHNLKRLLSADTPDPTVAVKSPKASSTSFKIKHHSSKSISKFDRQKVISQRLNLGVSTYTKKYSNLVMSAEDLENQQNLELAGKMRSSIKSPLLSMTLYDKEVTSPKNVDEPPVVVPQKKRFSVYTPKTQVDDAHKKTFHRIANNVRRATAFDPFNVKARNITREITHVSKENKPLLPVTTLLLISRNLNINSALRDLKQMLSKRRDLHRGEREISSLYHHNIFDNTRRIPPFLTNTPKQKMNTEFKMNHKPVLDILKLCDLAGYEHPKAYVDLIQVFIVDEHTAIPYAILSSEIENYKCNDIIVICHDMFGNFLDDLQYFEEYVKSTKNTKFLLFNLPGQAYTLYKEDHIYNNDYNSALIDTLLEELAREEKIDPRVDLFKFIGIGYGANILLYYSSGIDEGLFNKSYMLAINPFVSINDILRQTLEKSKQVFAETSESLKEMPNIYYNLTFGNSFMTEQEALEIASTNQITNNGRVTVVNGVLESFNIQKSVAQISCPIIVVHTLQNTITTNDHIYDLCHYKGEPVKMMHSKLSNFIADPHAKRMILNLKGSYASYEEREPSVMETIKNFIKSEPDQNNLLDWIMNEKMLIHTEQDILNLQELELEEVQGYIEKLSDVRKIAREIRDEFLIEAQNFAQNVDKKLADIEIKVERSEENINTLKQASMEKIRNREITPGMLEKVRRQHEERLMVIRDHLQVIRNHDREPLNLLLIIARDLDALDNHINAIATASNAKNLDQYYNELQSMLTKNVFDSDRIIEIINIKTGTIKVFADAKVALNDVYRHILHVEERYKAIPSVPLFDHNIQNLKTKGTELELHIIQLRLRLISFIESIMQYLDKLNLDKDQPIEYVNEVLNVYHREIIDFLDLLVIDDAKFVKINKNMEDPNYINSPGYLYTMAKMEIEGKYTKDLKISKLQEFKKRLEKASSMKKSLQNIDVTKDLQEKTLKIQDLLKSLS